MSIPTHSMFCVTKALSTTCPDCNGSVWFFSCNCGSKVFFEELGHPWLQHNCRNRIIREAIELLRINDRLTDKEIYDWVDKKSLEFNQYIPDEVVELLDNELGRRKHPLTIHKTDKLEGITVLSGRIMSINKQVSFRSRLKIVPISVIQLSLAGDLLSKDWIEVTIRDNPDSKNKCNEYIVFINSQKVKSSPIRLGQVLLGNPSKIKSALADVWELINYNTY